MTPKKKIEQLRNLIIDNLVPIIDSDYYLLEVPYYNNIGDTLIWQGEIDFLRTIKHKCKGMFSGDTFLFPEIKETDILLFQGGGNFGDLYPWNHDFKMNVIEHYPNNKAIIFPQTIWYENEENLRANAEFLSKHPNVIICARDKVSYETFKKYYKNQIILLPDMAFCIDINRWDMQDRGGKDLLLKRNDGELYKNDYILELEASPNVEVTDWPTMLDLDSFQTLIMKRFKRYGYMRPRNVTSKICDMVGYYYHRRALVKIGVHFLRTHKNIYTTRLHTAILSVLLCKEHIEFFDNSYGKNKNFYDTWLSDCDNIKLV